MENENSNPNSNQNTRKFLGDPHEASFFLLSSKGETRLTKVNPFVLTKTIEGMVGTPKKLKCLNKSGQILIEVSRKEQIPQLLNLKQVDGVQITVEPHPTLNSTKGVLIDRPGILSF